MAKDLVKELMQDFKGEPADLVPMLQSVQEADGFLSAGAMRRVSRWLKVSENEVYGVATFYHLFTFEPLGDHQCIVCTGTACHVKGADRIIEAVSYAFGIQAGETTEDGVFSLTTARCLGSCGLAPVVVFDGSMRGKETPETAVRQAQEVISLAKETA